MRSFMVFLFFIGLNNFAALFQFITLQNLKFRGPIPMHKQRILRHLYRIKCPKQVTGLSKLQYLKIKCRTATQFNFLKTLPQSSKISSHPSTSERHSIAPKNFIIHRHNKIFQLKLPPNTIKPFILIKKKCFSNLLPSIKIKQNKLKNENSFQLRAQRCFVS